MKTALDKNSPFYRECPYCNAPFIAHHGLQKFCPEKYDRANYCKNHFKMLAQSTKTLKKRKPMSEIKRYKNDTYKIVSDEKTLKIIGIGGEYMHGDHKTLKGTLFLQSGKKENIKITVNRQELKKILSCWQEILDDCDSLKQTSKTKTKKP